MQVGKYNLESLFDGRYSLTWRDNDENQHYKHIITNIDAIFDQVVDGTFEHRNNIVKLFNLYGTDTIKFLHDDKSIFLKEYPAPTPYVDSEGYKECMSCIYHELNYDKFIDGHPISFILTHFVKAYNLFNKCNVSVESILSRIKKDMIFW